jgi:hypothetical protein
MARFEIVICGDAETVADGYDFGIWQSERVYEAVGKLCEWIWDDLGEAIHNQVRIDSNFPRWHGGVYSKGDNACGLVWISSDAPRAVELAKSIDAKYCEILSQLEEVAV